MKENFMKALILAIALIPTASFADAVCVSPAITCEACCTPISYDWQGDMAIASTVLSSGYPVIGWAGPCRSADRQCPDILNQAADDLRVNALRANRAQGF